jgi:hypothetical protein
LGTVRKFEEEQMSYSFTTCICCKERRLDFKLVDNVCKKCRKDKGDIKMFSKENSMDPGPVPPELLGMTVVEQQLICKISPAIQLHMLKHGGLAAKGHCVTFPQEVDEPARIFPKLPKDIDVIRVRKKGRNDTTKDFRVRRFKVQHALEWLQANNPVYEDIIISQDNLSQLPLDGEIRDGDIFEYDDTNMNHINDAGPAIQQLIPQDADIDVPTQSTVILPDVVVDVRQQVEDAVRDVVGDNHGPVTENRRKQITIPWPTRGCHPLSEHTTNHFFTMAFPTLFPFGDADFRMNRPITCSSMADWADHLLWYEDGRFAKHQYFKFITHNIIIRKRTLEQTKFIVQQKLGEDHLTVDELKEMLNRNDNSIAKKILYFSNTLRGTPQYWHQRSKELNSLIQFNISEGNGLPSMFTTSSCAEYYFKPLKKLLNSYQELTSGKPIVSRSDLYEAIQQNPHVVTHYFDLRSKSYFKYVMAQIFGLKSYWYRYEFAPSRGMIHSHGLGWRADRQPHELLYQAVLDNLEEDEMAGELSRWAEQAFGMTASHPAGTDIDGFPRKDLWPPPEGTAQPTPEEDNPLAKLLSDVAENQEDIINDHLLLTNKVNLHRCSDFCWQKNRKGEKVCRMEYGKENSPGKPLRNKPAIVKDKNGSLRLEMDRDHPRMVQHSSIHTQAWRANGDISLVLSKSDPSCPSIEDIMPVERYVSGYACKGNTGTGAMCDLFKDMASSADSNSSSVHSLCTNLLMKSVKRDVSSVEACHELAMLPLYRCSHQFQSVSLTGSRQLERTGETATRHTPLDKYLARDKNDESSWYTFLCKFGRVPVIHANTYATSPITTEYARTILLLHFPNWRQISDIIGDSDWVTKFQEFVETSECPNFVKADIERSKEKDNNQQTEDVEEDDAIHDVQNQPEWLDLLQPDQVYDDFATDFQFDDGGPDYDWSSNIYPSNAETFFQTISEQIVEGDELRLPDVNLESMNEDQMFAYTLVMDAIIKHSRGEDVSLRLIVAGQAGSGKTYLINALVNSIRTFCKSNKAVQVLGPTGNSANLLFDGKTIHSFLKIPTGKKCGQDMTSPTGTTAAVLQINCDGLVCLITDERSLVGCNTLGWCEHHCQFGLKSNKEWGGLPVVVYTGDDIQLPPVCDSPPYKCTSTKPASMRGHHLWKSFTTVVTLRQVMRQDDSEVQLKNVLQRLRTYSATHEDTVWLQSFQWQHLTRKFGNDAMALMSDNALFAFPTHKEEWEHNKNKLLQANESFPIAKITAQFKGLHAKSTSADSSGGLIRVLYACKSARVNLTVNINLKFGLYNGTVGRVVDIVYAQGKSPTDGVFPEFIVVNFPQYTGPPWIEDNPTWIPVPAIERRLDCHCCTRTQLPLRPGFGTTIHRVQGMTIGPNHINRYIVISPGGNSFEARNPGILYVSLSRAKSAGSDTNLPDFAFYSQVLLNDDRVCYTPKTPLTKARNNEIKRLEKLTAETRQKFQHLHTRDAFIDIVRLVHSDAFQLEE